MIPPDRAGPSARRLLAESALVGLAWCLLPLLMLPEVALDPRGYTWGVSNADTLSLVWTLWHTGFQLVEEGRLGLYTTLVRHPEGGVLWPATPIEAVLAAPLTRLLGAVFVYNLLQVLHVGLSGAGMYALAHRLTGSRLAALAASPALALSPVLLCSARNGNVEVSQLYWLPLAGLAALSLGERGGPVRLVLAGLAIGLALISNIYVGIAAGVVATGLLLASAPEAARRLPGMALVALVVAGPPLILAASVLDRPDSLVSKHPEIVEHMRLMEGEAALLRFFVPAPVMARNPVGEMGAHLNGYAPSLVLVALALGGVFRRRRQDAVLGLLAGAGLLLSLGPVLILIQDPVAVGGRLVPLPYALLDHFPPFSMLIELWRFSVILHLALGLLAARTLAGLNPGPVLAGGGLVVAEALLLNPGPRAWETTRLPEAPLREILADLPAPGAVCMLPRQQYHWPLYFQTLHEQPITVALETLNQPYLDAVLGDGEWSLPELQETVQRVGIRWLVLNTTAEPQASQPMAEVLHTLRQAGLVTREHGNLVVVDLAAPGPWPERVFGPTRQARGD